VPSVVASKDLAAANFANAQDVMLFHVLEVIFVEIKTDVAFCAFEVIFGFGCGRFSLQFDLFFENFVQFGINRDFHFFHCRVFGDQIRIVFIFDYY
jgi:hypothetical protein